MFKEIQLKQRSEDWKLWRRTHITATDTAKIMGKSPWGTPLSCYKEKIEGAEKEITYAMQHGTNMETEALEYLEIYLNCNLEPACVESTQYPFMCASLDAIDDERSFIVEIKCPQKKAMDNALNEDYLESYDWQCQKQLLVTGLNKMYLFFYESPERNKLITIERDETMIKEIIATETFFWENHILKFIPPVNDKEILEVNDQEGTLIASRLVQLMIDEKHIKEEKESLQSRLKELYGDSNIFFPQANLKRLTVTKKGTVDYSKMITDLSIDKKTVDLYRKADSTYARFILI